MKKLLLISAALTILFCTAEAQVNLNVIIQKPMPITLSAWQTNPAIIQVIVSNTSANTYPNCIISIKVKDQNGNIIAKTKDTDPSMPKFNIPAAPNTLILYGNQIFKYNAVWVEPTIRTNLTTTNSLPEGDYQICMSLVDQNGNQLANGVEKCSDVNFSLPEPPQLIMPEDSQIITNLFPNIYWTPVHLTDPTINVAYRLKIVKLFGSQTAKDGITSNNPVLDKMITGTSYQYLPSDFNLGFYNDDFGFAWQVQVYNGITNQPLSGMGHDGKSEVWKFKIPSELHTSIDLISPLDNSNFSPADGGIYKFSWAAIKQRTSTNNFTLQIVEIKQGQTADIAMQSNPTIYSNNELGSNVFSCSLSEKDNSGVFYTDHKYAWQVLSNTSKGEVLGKSPIRSFTIKSGFDQNLYPLTPLNNTVLEPDSVHYSIRPGYTFTWKPKNVSFAFQSYRFYIVPVNDGETAEYAASHNNPILDSIYYNANTGLKIIRDLGILENDTKYAWSVWGYKNKDLSDLRGIVDPQLFTVSGAPRVAADITTLNLGHFNIKINSVANRNTDKFTGTGEIFLCPTVPVINLDFKNLKIRKHYFNGVLKWVVTEGEIIKDFTANIPLNTSIDQLNSTFFTTKIKMTKLLLKTDVSQVYGTIVMVTPFIARENLMNHNYVIESAPKNIDINPQTGFSADSLFLPRDIPEMLFLCPLDYKLLLHWATFFTIKNDVASLNLSGIVTLPSRFKNNLGQPMYFIFNNVDGFIFDVDYSAFPMYYNLKACDDFKLKINKVRADFYLGRVYVRDGSLDMNQQKFGITPIQIMSNYEVCFSSAGFQSDILRSNQTNIITYRGYQYNITDIRFYITNDAFNGQNYLEGDVIVPFLNQKATMQLNLCQSGVLNGNVNISKSGSYITMQEANGGAIKLMVEVTDICYLSKENLFRFSGNFMFSNLSGKGLTTDPFFISNFLIDSTGKVIYFSKGTDGWTHIANTSSGKFNGWPISISKLKITDDYYKYNFSVGGSIVLADNLSKPGGTEFAGGLDIQKPTFHGGLPPVGDSIKTEPIGVEFGNDQTKFGCSVSWFEGDPVYGSGFMATTDIQMHSPGEFSAGSKILIGKTDNGNKFSYWYIDAHATLPKAIPTGILDIGVKSFEARIYSHMKHQSNDTYTPDQSNTFGIYGMTGFASIDGETDGKTLWGTLQFEFTGGSGFTAKFIGDVYILTSGWQQKDATINGHAELTFSTNPMLFYGYIEANANFKDVVKAHGTMEMEIRPDYWKLQLGDPVIVSKQVSIDVLDQNFGYSGYFKIDNSSCAVGLSYYCDTGYHEWGEVLGCYGRAWGSISGSAQLNYSPFQFTGNALISGGAEIGVFVHVWKFHGRKRLFYGEILNGMTLTFPDPLCVAGYVYASLCFDPCPIGSCDICASATLKLRYKNGSFALKSNCDD